MKVKVFTVFDMKMQFFAQPFFEQQEASAIRSFSDAVNDANPKNMWYLHPEDFQLYCIGTFDNETGVLESQLPQVLVNASALYRRVVPDDSKAVDENKKLLVN